MRSIILLALLGVSLSVQASNSKTTVTERDYELPQCAAPVAKVVIGEVSCRSAGCQATQGNDSMAGLARLAELASGQSNVAYPGIGEGMASMLTTALQQTGCFDVQEREALEQLRQELKLVGRELQAEQADFMISGAITSIGTQTQRRNVGGGFIPIVGSVSRTRAQSELSMDLRIIDVNSARVVSTQTFVADNTTTSSSWGGATWAGVGGIVGGMSNVRGTPMEAIVRDVLIRAASHSASTIIGRRQVATPTSVETPVQAPIAEAPSPGTD